VTNETETALAKRKTWNIAGVGIGGIWHGAHATPWLEHEQVNIVAVCDIQKSKAEKFAQAHDIDHIFEDYTQVLKLDEVEVVDICTSNKFHSEIAVAALEAGKHVFCEKPDAINAGEAQRMADAAKASGKTLMVMRNNRFRPETQFLKRYTDAGQMGDLYTGRCGWIRRRGIPGKGGWFTTKQLSGGGPLIDLGVHMIDLAIWLMGNPTPVAVSASTYRKFAESEAADSIHSSFGEKVADGTFDVEDLAIGFIRFDNDASLQVEVSWASNIGNEHNFVELRGSKGGCKVGGGVTEVYTEIEGTLCDIIPRTGKRKVDAHAANLLHFIEVLNGEAEPIFVPQQGVNMIKILQAMYESADSGREVRLQ
jgi:predicted dehydrogenase